MKILKIQLVSPPQGVYYPGMTVQGTLTVENDSGPKEYNSIEVTLKGEAYVNIRSSQQRDTRQISPHEGHEVFFKAQSVLWDKDRDGRGRKLYPTGTHKYHFSFDLVAPSLPPTYNSTHGGTSMGFVCYSVDATIQRKMGYLNITVSTPITVASAVSISDPALLWPCSKQAETSICCCCCPAGFVFLKATVPRAGYCVTGNDTIPLEVYTENNSWLSLWRLEAAIIKTVGYRSSRGFTKVHSIQVTKVVGEQSIASNSSVTWKTDIKVPCVDTTSESCPLIMITYSVEVTAVSYFNCDTTISIPIVLGNIPLDNPQAPPPQPTPKPRKVVRAPRS